MRTHTREIFLIQLKSDCNRAFAQGDDESDDDYFPPLEEVFQTPFPTKASAKPFKSKHNQQHVEKPASDATGIHVDHTKLGLGDRPGESQGRHISSLMWQAAANDPQTNQ